MRAMANAVAATSAPALPDEHGHFGPYGGAFVPETLVAALQQLEREYKLAKADPEFCRVFQQYLGDYVGRPSRLYFARRLTAALGGAKVYLKREDLNHTGAHKINNTIGQALLTLPWAKAADCRNRGRSTRRGHGHGGGAV